MKLITWYLLEMDIYWLIMDSYAFIWNNERAMVVYNSLSGVGFECSLSESEVLKNIVEGLKDEKNLYCVELSSENLQDDGVKRFLGLLRCYFCGDIVKRNPNGIKPVSILPQVSINEEVGRDFGEVVDFESFGHHVVKNLLELTIYLNGDPLSEEGSFCRQFIWSCPGGPVLDSDKLAKIAKQIESTRVVDFNIVTSDLFAYPYLKELFLLLETSSLNTTFYLPYKSLAGRKLDKELSSKEHIQLCILVDSPEEIDNIDMSVFSEYNVQFFFKIVSVDEYMAAADRIARYNLKAKILPYYNGDNYSFFEEQIFLDKEDILNTQWTKQQIFAHQVINTKDFGKFTVLPTGKIYGNINFEAVGTVEDDMKELVYKEMKNGSSWRRVRSLQKKCGACLYRYLCPSPSNYELCIGKDNLCHLYSEKDI